MNSLGSTIRWLPATGLSQLERERNRKGSILGTAARDHFLLLVCCKVAQDLVAMSKALADANSLADHRQQKGSGQE